MIKIYLDHLRPWFTNLKERPSWESYPLLPTIPVTAHLGWPTWNSLQHLHACQAEWHGNTPEPTVLQVARKAWSRGSSLHLGTAIHHHHHHHHAIPPHLLSQRQHQRLLPVPQSWKSPNLAWQDNAGPNSHIGVFENEDTPGNGHIDRDQ